MPKSTHALYLEIKEHGALVACASSVIVHPIPNAADLRALGHRGDPDCDKSERLCDVVNSYKLMDFARMPITTSVSLSAPEELINSSEFSQPLREGILVFCIFFNHNWLPCNNSYSAVCSPVWCCMTIMRCRRKLIDFKWNLSRGKSIQSSWFHLYIFILKLMSVPVRDGIIDLNQIMKHYTFYSEMHFSGIQFCNVSLSGNAGRGWRSWKILLSVV